MKKLITIIGMFLIYSALVAQGDVKTRVYEVWDDQPTPNRGKDYSWIQSRGYPADPDWEAHSYLNGNGYMGANIFGRTDVERVQITDKTLTNGAPYGSGGMTNFAGIFWEFDHYTVNNYKRSLHLNEGISYVSYEWETYNDLLKSAKILEINDPFLETVSDQINKLDAILIGESGQIKEYREEEKYGDIGNAKHRHISHLCPIYPGTLINSNHSEWVKATSQTLDFRGNNTTGWAMPHRINVRARTNEADEASEVYSKFLRERTIPNLWTVHAPFQIDGNLGIMAGVAEMLIQSHECFIELLPALPKAWETGSFDGLVARGNFEIAASWKDKNATSFSIISGSGAKCTLKYPNIENAQITNVTGGHVSFSKEGENLISFDTDKMGRYLISLKE